MLKTLVTQQDALTLVELPYDTDITMESERHRYQIDMLIDTISGWMDKRDDGHVNGNTFVYFSPQQLKNEHFLGPDFFVALGVPKKERRSWICWEENKSPDVVIELLSDKTKRRDKNAKKLIYQDMLCVYEYYWFDPFNPEDLAGFKLAEKVYQPIIPNSQNQLVSSKLQLALVRWQGMYRGIYATWLRWITLDGKLLPTSQEQAEQAEIQLKALVNNLVQNGMSVEQIANLINISASEVEKILS